MRGDERQLEATGKEAEREEDIAPVIRVLLALARTMRLRRALDKRVPLHLQ